MSAWFLKLKECIKFQRWLDIYCFISSWSQKDLQGNRWSPEWWRACQSLWTSPRDDHICSVCQWWVWLWHGLWARNRPLLLRIPRESRKVLHESHSTLTLRDLTLLHPLFFCFLTFLLNILHETKYSDIAMVTFLYTNASFLVLLDIVVLLGLQVPNTGSFVVVSQHRGQHPSNGSQHEFQVWQGVI